MRKRGFEIVKGYDEKEINIPRRKTKYSAGYDFEAAKDVTILPGYEKPTLVPTGIKAYMEDDEVLKIYNRSSNPSKKHIILANEEEILNMRKGGFGSTGK